MKGYRKPYRIKRKKSVFRSPFLWISLLFLLILIWAAYFAVFSSLFQVKEIKISGNKKISTQDIKNSIEEKVGLKFFSFPTQSIFLINIREIIQSLSLNFPQIDKIELRRKLPATLIAEIQERIAVAAFCQNEQCFLIDKNGVIFEADSPDDNSIIRFEGNEVPASSGKKVVQENIMEVILEIGEKLKTNFKIYPKEFILWGGDRINVKTAEGWEIYFAPLADINWQLIKLNSVLKKQIPAEKIRDLEYIELRFGNYASYKYRETPNSQPEQ